MEQSLNNIRGSCKRKAIKNTFQPFQLSLTGPFVVANRQAATFAQWVLRSKVGAGIECRPHTVVHKIICDDA